MGAFEALMYTVNGCITEIWLDRVFFSNVPKKKLMVETS